MSSTNRDDAVRRDPGPERAWFPRFLVAFVCVFVAGFLVLNAPDAVDEAEVPVDGQPHTVPVSAFTASVIWVDGSLDEPVCRVTDPPTGIAISPAPPSRSRPGDDGPRDGYVTLLAFTPSTDTVVVTCTGSTGVALVSEENPGTPYRVARYGGAGLLALIGVGLLVQIARWGLASRRRRV